MPQINNEDEALEMLRVLTENIGVSQTAIAKNLRLSRTLVTNVINRNAIVTPKFIDRLNQFVEHIKIELSYE
jgi:plasmid maintenance system antidote protein VapI